MNDDILASYRGNIYLSPSNWGCGVTLFRVVRVIQESNCSDPLIEIKLLDKSKQPYPSCWNSKRGHTAVTLRGIDKCKTVNQLNITEYLKAWLF